MKKLVCSALVLGLAGASLGCGVDEVPEGLKRTPDGDGPTVRFDLYHKPLPEIPLPNDTATWPDPTSRTGKRVNASVIAPTEIEATAREKFDTLEGWGTYSPITVAFDKTNPKDTRAAIDLRNVIARHHGDDYDFADDAIYIVNLTTGVPAVFDAGSGNFQYIIRSKEKYWLNDTRRWEQNLMWDTVDERVDPATGDIDTSRLEGGQPDGMPIYKPEWDTDFDGVIDVPNLLKPDGCPNQADLALGNVTEVERDKCIANQLLTYYERETDTLILRPLVPLEEKTEYAVVVTNRLVDPDGNPVRSPFDYVYHPSQLEAMKRLERHLENPDLSAYFGDLGGKGFDGVAFAWSFTTQPVQEDLKLIRDGLYGTGPLAHLAEDFPANAEMARAAGVVDLEALAEGAQEPAGWQDRPACQESVNRWRVVTFDPIRDTLESLAEQGFGIEGPGLDALIESFQHVSHIAVGTFDSPFFISGGPKGTDPNASFNMDFHTGKGELHRDKVQFMIAIPKETAEHKQPFNIAYYGHGYTSSTLEALGFAGHLAAQGIASVGMNATFHQLEVDPAEFDLAKSLFAGACAAPFSSAFFAGRSRDLDGNGVHDSGGDYWTSYLFHTRDVVRQSAIDQLQMFRVFKEFGTKNVTKQSVEDPTVATLAGDFDNDGVPDAGGPDAEFYAWGQSLGGILSPFAAALDPDVVAAAPGAGAAGLLDVGARTFQGGAFEGIYLRNFGPLVAGVPVVDQNGNRLIKEGETACTENQVSLRFVVVDVNNDREVEFECLDLTDAAGNHLAPTGGTVFVVNRDNGERRCARMDGEGRFRIGIPSSINDRLEVQIYDKPDAVATYDADAADGCQPTLDDEHRIALIDEWGAGLVAPNSRHPTIDDLTVCNVEEGAPVGQDGCSRFQDKYYKSGSPLVAIAEGFGHIRQTPGLRRFMALASNIVDPGDPANFLPYLSVRTMTDPWGKPHPPTGMLNFVTIGDMNVPLNAGIAMGRVAGAVPFFRPDAAEKYPHYADYVTPEALYQELGEKTPNQMLIDNYVTEGINRLERHPVEPTACGVNEVPVTADNIVCHPNCTPEDTSSCLSGQECVNNRCVKRPFSDSDCRQFLYDVDVLDEGQMNFGEEEATVPLRTGRIAMPADPSTIDDVWEPRLTGTPYSSDMGAWQADKRVISQLMAYVEPKGVHGFDTVNPCMNFDVNRYMINLLGRFFSTSGTDVYYLSHPSSHRCLGRAPNDGGCPFVPPPPAE